jgi:hypothetical protein
MHHYCTNNKSILDKDCCDVFAIETLQIRCTDIAQTVGLNSGEKFAELEIAWNRFVGGRKHLIYHQALKVKKIWKCWRSFLPHWRHICTRLTKSQKNLNSWGGVRLE